MGQFGVGINNPRGSITYAYCGVGCEIPY